MNISPHWRAKAVQAPATLPVELCEVVLKLADLSADELVRCARSLSKAPNSLSEAAQSLPVWRSWHPQTVTDRYLEVRDRQPDYLVIAFLERHAAYSSGVRQDLRRYRNSLWRRPEIDARKFFDIPYAGAGFSFQCFNLAEKMAWESSLFGLRKIGHASASEAFDTAMALLRHRPDSERAYDDVLPLSLCAEPEFLRKALAVRPAWLSQAAPRYKNDPQIQHIAFAAVLERLKKPYPGYYDLNFPEIPAEFFANFSAMRTAIAYDRRFFHKASDAVRSDPKFLQVYREVGAQFVSL